MAKTIAILGWGSLLWDLKPDFDDYHGDWHLDGPELKLEFSRISRSRGNALTLVIDPEHGQVCQVAYALSERVDPMDAITDLRCREQTVLKNIGYWLADGRQERARDATSAASIADWAAEKRLDALIWTDLDRNFKNLSEEDFLKDAVRHVQDLPVEGKARAAEYLWRAPEFVRTPLRGVLQAQPWFRSNI